MGTGRLELARDDRNGVERRVRQATATEVERRNRKVAMVAACVAFGMLGMAYAAVPLYRLFCQVTGFNGTTQRAAKPSDAVVDRMVRVRFDANVGPGLGWEFVPLQRTVDVKLGENVLVFYRAVNRTDHQITGSATFNVTPETMGGYFAKIACFCFTEQTLAPGESIDMPVSFYVDPAMLTDTNTERITQLTLSYTFYPVAAKAAAAPVVNGKGS